jgi:hypothetical protein
MTDANTAYPDEEKALNAALAKAQGEFPQIHKTQTADAGSYTYSYVDLATILAAVRPVLAKNGLALVQRLEQGGTGPAIRTELRHEQGASIAASFPIGERPNNPQQLGSLLTYLRRYAVQAMLGIAAEDDDAASVASPFSAKINAAADGMHAPAAAEASPFQPPEPRQEPLVEDLTNDQRKKIFAIKTKLTNAGVFDDDAFRAQLVKDYEVDSVSGLTKSQASEVIGRLETREKALDKETA